MKPYIRHDKRKLLERIEAHLSLGTPKHKVCSAVAREFDLTYERIRQLWRNTQPIVIEDDLTLS